MHKTFSQYLYEQKFKMIEFDKDSKESDEESKSSEDTDDNKIKDDDTSEKNKDSKDDKSSDDNDTIDDNSSKDKDDKDKKKENPDKQGVLRKIQYAHLIYKRQDVDGTYTELWSYDINKGIKDEFNIRNAILNGTDIDHKTGSSPDNIQRYELWTSNNRQFMQITGLPN